MDFWADLKLPRGILVKGGIPTSQDPADLVSDMVEIDLPDGTTLDVGWVPEHDPSGRYRLKVYRSYWSETVEGPSSFESREAVIAAIQEIVREHSAARLVVRSGSTEVVIPPMTTNKRVPGYVAVGARS